MARTDAAPLIALSDKISREGACAQARDIPKLQSQTVALVNARRIPPALAESLMSGVNALAVEMPVCLPPVPAAETTPAPAPPPVHGPPRPHGHGHDEHHHEHKGKDD